MPVFVSSVLPPTPGSNSHAPLDGPYTHTPLRPLRPLWLSTSQLHVAILALAAVAVVLLACARICSPCRGQNKQNPERELCDLPRDSGKRESFAHAPGGADNPQQGESVGKVEQFQGQANQGQSAALLDRRAASLSEESTEAEGGRAPQLWPPTRPDLQVQGQGLGQGGWPKDLSANRGPLPMDSSGLRNEGSRGVSRSASASASSSSRHSPDGRASRNSRSRYYHNHPPRQHQQPHQHQHQHLSSPFTLRRRPVYEPPSLLFSQPPPPPPPSTATAARRLATHAIGPHTPSRQHYSGAPPARSRGHSSASPDGRSGSLPLTGTVMGRDGYIQGEGATLPPTPLPPLSVTNMTGSPVDIAAAPRDVDFSSSPYARRRFSRPPPPPPLTPPRLSTTAFIFESRRPSYASSIPPDLELEAAANAAATSFIHQPNPQDYLDTPIDGGEGEEGQGSGEYRFDQSTEEPGSAGDLSSRPATATTKATSHQRSSPSGSSSEAKSTRRRSYNKRLSITMHAPAATTSYEQPAALFGTAGVGGEFAPSSFPSAQPQLPPPPPGWELDGGYGHELYEGTEEVFIPFTGSEAEEEEEEEETTGEHEEGSQDDDEVFGDDEFQAEQQQDTGAGVLSARAAGKRRAAASRTGMRTGEIGVQGEIISVIDKSGAGWTRHTRVYGGGVCLACAAAGGRGGGGFYGANVRPEDKF